MSHSPFLKNVKLSNPIHFLAVGLGSGLSKVMPGTIGSLAAVPLWFLFYDLTPILYATFILVMFIFGCFICKKTSDDTNTHDSSHIVWDEFIGMWITLYFMPTISISWLIVAFLLFRVFDILKPWPIKPIDKKMTSGVGIMLDDVIAAVFAVIVIFLWQFALTYIN